MLMLCFLPGRGVRAKVPVPAASGDRLLLQARVAGNGSVRQECLAACLALSGCMQALKDANLKLSDINEVILVGGSTRIPAVQVTAVSSLPWLAPACSSLLQL